MFEILFILIVIYIAYVINSDEREVDKPPGNDIAVSAKIPPVNASTTPSTNAQKSVAKAKTGKSKPVSKKHVKAKINKMAAPKIELRTIEMKNPKTGEQAKVANNYRMVKRWIKEALVEEGLLEKIYKVNEMDDTAKAEVAKALSIIKAMDKYKV